MTYTILPGLDDSVKTHRPDEPLRLEEIRCKKDLVNVIERWLITHFNEHVRRKEVFNINLNVTA